MDIRKIKPGMALKNYPHLCQLLGESVRGGDAKKAQLKKWEKYFSFKQQGHQFEIIDIYQTPKQAIDGRGLGNNTIYGNYIQELLLDILSRTAEEDQQELRITATNMLNLLSMVNDMYVHYRRVTDKKTNQAKRQIFSDEIGIKTAIINNFFDVTHNKLKKILEYTFNKLERQGYIFWSRVVIVAEKNKMTKQEYEEHREADSSEIEVILQCKKEVLNAMNFLSERKAINRWIDYIEKLNAKIQEKTEGKISYMYISYKLVLNRKGIREENFKEFKLERRAAFNLKKELNDVIAKNLSQSRDKRYLSKKPTRDKLIEQLILFLN